MSLEVENLDFSLNSPSDGTYEGQLENGVKQGKGNYTWKNGERYSGDFYQDHRHGFGKYKWPDGSEFNGCFYMNHRHAYGSLTLTNDTKFEGLYRDDVPFGPGVLTYSDGATDLGWWAKDQIVKLCLESGGAFSMSDHPEFSYTVQDHIQPIFLNELCGKQRVLAEILPDVLQYHDVGDADVLPGLSGSLSQFSLAFDKTAFDLAFYSCLDKICNCKNKDAALKMREQSSIDAWNNSRFLKQMQLQMIRMKLSECLVTFNVENLIACHSEPSKIGPRQKDALEFLSSARAGDVDVVSDLLFNKKVDPNVADRHGRFALIETSINWHHPIINLLLDNGADINRLTDEGVSALVACHIFYYPPELFRYNIAETYLPTPQHESEEEEEAQALPRKQRSPPRKVRKTKKLTLAVDNNAENETLEPPPSTPNVIDRSSSKCAEKTIMEDFSSYKSLCNMPIQVNPALVDRCANIYSRNKRVVSAGVDKGVMRNLALEKAHREKMKSVIELLLRRGANPNVSIVPMSPIFFAVKAADVHQVRLLLLKGADPNHRLSVEKGFLTPLHIAAAMPGPEGVEMTELLLNSLADPNARACEDDSFLIDKLEDEWSKDVIDVASKGRLGGRTPLQIACSRNDNFEEAAQIARLLLERHARTDLLCNGNSALSLAIMSGNDMAVDELLHFNADPSLPLTHGVGSALCVALHPDYEFRRCADDRTKLVKKLLDAGADILAPVAVGPKRSIGSVVDYVHYIYNLDKRIAHMPYHALNQHERETFIARKNMLDLIGDAFREKAIQREHDRLMEQIDSPRRVAFSDDSTKLLKSLSKYCYHCGRQVGVRLSPCTRCKEVYFCSKTCKVASWNARHRNECLRIAGHGKTAHRADSPTPATGLGQKSKTTVGVIASERKVKVPFKGRSKSVIEKKPDFDPDSIITDNYSFI